MSSQIWEKLEKEKQAELFLSRPILGDTNLSGGGEARGGVGVGHGSILPLRTQRDIALWDSYPSAVSYCLWEGRF